MEKNSKYIPLNKLEVYKLYQELSDIVWRVYQKLDWHIKKVTGDQLLESIDSVGANIAEGYGRFHYLDRIKFCYNARGSLIESRHWIDVLDRRKILAKKDCNDYLNCYKKLRPGVNALINSLANKKKQIS